MFKNNEYKIFIICNPKYEKDRYNYLQQEINKFNLDVTYFQHIWGTEITNDIRMKHCKSDFTMKRFANRSMIKSPLSNSELSLFINHVECLKFIHEKFKDKQQCNFIIFESDIRFKKDFITRLSNIINCLSNIPDWDIIDIGEGFRHGMLHYPKNKPILVNNEYFSLEDRTSCTEAFIWNYKSVSKFVSYFKKNNSIDAPFDVKLDHINIPFNIFWLHNTLVYQGSIHGEYSSNMTERENSEYTSDITYF